MKNAWCLNCKSDVSLLTAIDNRPCPRCGSKQYIIPELDDETIIAIADTKAEIFMQKGMWNEAASALSSCSILSPCERTLRSALLECRQDCAQYIQKTLIEPMPLETFKKTITAEYDIFTAEWFLQSYQDIRLIPNGDTYDVVRRNEC